MSTPGLIPKILGKIQEARRPDRFTQDFLETKLGFSGGSARAVIPLLKRMGIISSDGTPTKLYDQFRNSDTQDAAMNAAVRAAYSELFERNEYVHNLSREKLIGLVTEITGASADDTTTKCIVSTFFALKEFTDFESKLLVQRPSDATDEHFAPPNQNGKSSTSSPISSSSSSSEEVSFAVSYTINLNLPETTNPEVFNAIFKALKDNLLTRR